MHHRLIVLTDKQKGDRSLKVRERTSAELLNNGFIDDQGHRDWFVIGGRWSGVLSRNTLSTLRLKLAWKAIQEDSKTGYDPVYTTPKPTKRQINASNKIFKEFFPDWEGESLMHRDTYNALGYPDDAMLINEVLMKRLINKIWDSRREPMETIGWLEGDIRDLNKKDIVGKKWAVVVDFHT